MVRKMRKLSKEEKEMANYMELCLYNKTKEIEMKVLEGKAFETEKERFENVFRTEVKIKNGKINSNISKDKMKDKSIETYYNKENTTELYNTPVQKIFGVNDFYRIDVAIKIIDKDKSIRKKTKAKLKTLLRKINKLGYTDAKEYWVKKYSEVTFRNHIKKIEALGINVLTFDKKINGLAVERDTIRNFTKLENSVNNQNLDGDVDNV